MKRKFKLFATVASLCLCLALMAFGVYAASSVNYKASGKVSYEVKDLLLDIDFDIEGLAQPEDHNIGYTKGSQISGSFEAIKDSKVENGKSIYADHLETYDKAGDVRTPKGNTSGKSALELTTAFSDENKLDFNKYSAFEVTITIKTYNQFAVAITQGEVKYTAGTNEATGGNAYIVAKTGNDLEVAAATTEGSVGTATTLTYYIALIDPAKAALGSWEINLSFAKKQSA